MMRRRGKDLDARGKALDTWQPPPGSGEPLFCVATTFTFDATFFEVECLGRFLQMDTHPQETESVGYLIEREEKLAGARVCVLADRRHATEKESLRWDVLPVVVPRAAQHAKLALLGWSNRVRVIIGSGNLTEQGYRKNLEVFGCLETARDDAGNHSAILEAIAFLEEVAGRALGDEARQGPGYRLRQTLTAARDLISDWPHEDQGRGRLVPIFGGAGTSIFSQLRTLWPSGSPPRYSHVLSPFFDADSAASAVAEGLVDMLAKRGDRICRFYVAAEELADGRRRVYAPRGLIDAVREHAITFVHTLLPEQDGEVRPLHAKMLALHNDEWQLLVIGSSNFTRAGLGITAGNANLEANLAYVTRSNEPAFRAMENVWPQMAEEEVDINDPAIVWDPAFDQDSDGTGPLPLPAAFREALFDGGSSPPQLILSLGSDMPSEWIIRTPADQEVLRRESWAGQPGDVHIPWGDRPVPFILHVTWGEQGHAADWPVNVVDTRTLPPPDALRQLTLEELLDILASTRPLHRAVVEVLRKRERHKSSVVELDPHKRVNTETFLLQRTKPVALALERLRERLERPVASLEGLDWRLRGPIGPSALAEAFKKDARSPGEARFFMAELALALKRVRVDEAACGGIAVDLIRDRLATSISDLEAQAGAIKGEHGLPLDRYIIEAFAAARKH
jgi:hypothetical protein